MHGSTGLYIITFYCIHNRHCSSCNSTCISWLEAQWQASLQARVDSIMIVGTKPSNVSSAVLLYAQVQVTGHQSEMTTVIYAHLGWHGHLGWSSFLHLFSNSWPRTCHKVKLASTELLVQLPHKGISSFAHMSTSEAPFGLIDEFYSCHFCMIQMAGLRHILCRGQIPY